jgi:hypothetical protein
MSDKRRLKRRHLIYYLSVFDNETGQLLGQLVDITTRGIMVTSERPIPLGERHTIRMVLPDIIDGNNQIVFKAESVWCEKDINPNFYAIGFELADISKRDINIIENLIQDFSFLD